MTAHSGFEFHYGAFLCASLAVRAVRPRVQLAIQYEKKTQHKNLKFYTWCYLIDQIDGLRLNRQFRTFNLKLIFIIWALFSPLQAFRGKQPKQLDDGQYAGTNEQTKSTTDVAYSFIDRLSHKIFTAWFLRT